jgi:hypothetical protein
MQKNEWDITANVIHWTTKLKKRFCAVIRVRLGLFVVLGKCKKYKDI